MDSPEVSLSSSVPFLIAKPVVSAQMSNHILATRVAIGLTKQPAKAIPFIKRNGSGHFGNCFGIALGNTESASSIEASVQQGLPSTGPSILRKQVHSLQFAGGSMCKSSISQQSFVRMASLPEIKSTNQCDRLTP